MNNHSIAKAVDPNRGEYVVYKDIYDLNPFHGSRSIAEIPGLSSIDDLSMGIGKPVHLYDRIYLDDYYGVDNKPDANTYWGKWLPEVTVKGKKHSKGGNLFDGMTMPS